MAEQEQRVMIDPGLLRARGKTGLNRWSGVVDEEWLPELSGKEGLRIYRRMAEGDAIVGAVLYAVEQILRTTSWSVEPAGDSNLDRQKADFLKSCMEDTSHTWSDFISEVLSMLPYGFSLVEIIYKQRLGDNKDARKRSKFNDGRIGWRSLAIRAQTTIDEWDFDDDGGVQGCWQVAPPDFKRVYLPMEKCLLFRTKVARNNPQGTSVLRTAYESWYYRKNLREIEGIGLERMLVGLPVIWAPMNLFRPDATQEEKAILERLYKIATNIRIDEQGGLVMPRDPDRPDAFEIELLSHRGGRANVADAVSGPIERYSKEIAMSVLADVILIGHAQVGSYALSETKSELFAYALTAFMDSIEQVLNRYAVPRLFKLNTFPEQDRLPQFKHGNVMVPDLKTLGQYISHLARSGMRLFPDERLESELRRVANLPPKMGGGEEVAAPEPEPDSPGPEIDPEDRWEDFESRLVSMVEERMAKLERMVRSLERAGGDGE